MSISPSPCDPYVTLGVGKDANLSEIKAAHRKLVLKCHPDKIQDESLRNRARDQFQRVQESYELLSDEKARSRYDQKVLLAELRKEVERATATGASSYPSRPSREYRDGRMYEERAPADASFLDDDIVYTEEPESYSRKHDDYHRRPRSSRGDDKKKPSRPATTPTVRSPKESSREFSRSHSDRAKYRTKERRREYSDKYDRHEVYVEDESSDYSSPSTIYVKVKRPSESRRSRDQASHRRPTESLRRSESNRRYRDDEDYSDDYTSKHDFLHTSARDYILRSKNSPIIEVDNRSRAPRSPTSHPTTTGYESSDRDKEPSSAAAAAATASSTRRHRHTHSKPESRTASPRRGHRKSSERLDSWSSPKDYDRSKVPPLPTANSSPAGIKLSTSRSGPTLQPPAPSVSRSVTAPHGKVRREGSSRSEGTNNPLYNMVPGGVSDAAHSRSKARSTDKHDSGYSSPGTPETPQGPGVPKLNRYKIVEPPETVTVEPEPRSSLGSSPPRQERSSAPRSSSKVSRTAYSYSAEQLGRQEPTRSSNKTSPSVSKHLFGEVRFAREIKPNDIEYGFYEAHIPVGRRQSACG